MIIKNYELKPFGEFLMELKLKGKQSRMRMRFVRLLQDRVQLLNEEREQLIKDYSKKDEEGDPVVEKDEEGNEMIKIADENRQEYQIDFQDLLMEDFIIEHTADREEMLNTVMEVVLECDLEFSGQEAVQYDRWCEIVENESIEM